MSYSACTFIGGIDRTVITKRDAPRNLCVVLVLSSPGTNSFNLTLPANWGVEAAFAMPAGAACNERFPPPGAVEAVAGRGSVAFAPTPQPTVDADVTLTFPATDAGTGAVEEILMTRGLLAPIGCP